LARELRHRIIHPTAIFPAPDYHRVLVDGVPIPPTDVEIVPRERLDDGDVVLYFTLAGVSANADVHPQFVITVGIDHPLCRGQIGTTVVSEIGVAATRAMNAIETRFFGPSHDLRPVKTET